MDGGTLAFIALQLIAFSITGVAAGELILQWADLIPKPDKVGPQTRFQVIWTGITERALSAIVGFVAFSVALMSLNIVTRGLVFGTPGLVPALALALIVFWWRRHEPMPRPRSVSWIRLTVLIVVLGALFALPGILTGSSIRTGDPPWHLGWTEQLLAGEPVPVGPAPEFARNAYPWGLHGVMATLVRLVPGSDPRISLETLHLVIVAGLPLAAAVLAFRLRRNAGWAAAACVALIGGFGWMTAGEPDFATSPGNARYGADLVVASPNTVYEMLPPALPRELGVVLLGAAGLFLLIGTRNRNRRVELLAGFTAGLAGLVSVPMFVSALIWMLMGGIVLSRDRWRFIKHTVGGAMLVFALWALPVFIDYLTLGGFVNITPRLGKEWPLWVAFGAWGILLPLAAIGIYLAIYRMHIEERVLLAFMAGTTVVLLLSILRGLFDWDLAGNATLLHQGRVWPPLHLLGAVFAGSALTWAAQGIRPRALGYVAVAAVVSFGAVSTVYASLHITEVMDRAAAGFVYGTDDVRSDERFLRQAAELLGPDDIVAVLDDSDTANALAFQLFELSGVRLASYDHPNLSRNDLRIRFSEPAEKWQAVVDAGGFEPNYIVQPSDDPTEGTLVEGLYRGERWALVSTR